MTPSIEKILESIQQLPASEQEKVRQWLEELRATDGAEGAASGNGVRAEKSLRWLADNREQYLGQWVALDGDRLISNGKTAKEVYAKAKAEGIKIPLRRTCCGAGAGTRFRGVAWMSETITFDSTHIYNSRSLGISVPAILHHGAESIECEAKLDTGSSHRIFKRSYGELLGLNIESTPAEKISTVTGGFFAHPHVIALEALCIRSDTVVYFAADEFFIRNVLGRIGWLDHVKLGLIDYESKLLLSPYY